MLGSETEGETLLKIKLSYAKGLEPKNIPKTLVNEDSTPNTIALGAPSFLTLKEYSRQ